ALDLAEQLGDAVLEDLAADDADVAMRRRLGGEMLAAAEADLEPDIVHRRGEQRGGIERARRRQRDGEARQQRVDQALLAGMQLPAASASVEDAATARRLLGP